MTSPDEIIENWRKHIKKEKDKDVLETIKLDLEAEKDNYEEVIREYENLINDVEEKIK